MLYIPLTSIKSYWFGEVDTRALKMYQKKVTYEELYHCKNKCRIKAANGLMVATVIGCLVAVYMGKQARARGETVAKMNLDWHKEVNRKMDEEEERKSHQSK
ncbi:UPF0389 protein GA21628 [Nilaparvata lugens]|uniref:UPF0389 protein GA21628 n=1 Tax=Nilaparvata lugens TaxID=108931 RepID=UPI00193E61C7|nr:UPF0389 protein GA21628 [Nilaparvata lugens]